MQKRNKKPEFFIDKALSEYDSVDKKLCPLNNIAALYERMISNLNSEIAFLKEELVTRDNFFQEEILF